MHINLVINTKKKHRQVIDSREKKAEKLINNVNTVKSIKEKRTRNK